jgi:hypothetical protein
MIESSDETPAATATIVFEPPALSFSYPAALSMHFIYDTELVLLEQGGKDHSLEISLGAAGAGIGLLQNLLKASYDVIWTRQVPDGLDFVLGLVCIALVTVAIVSYKNSSSVASRIGVLVNDIRARPKKGQPAG